MLGSYGRDIWLQFLIYMIHGRPIQILCQLLDRLYDTLCQCMGQQNTGCKQKDTESHKSWHRTDQNACHTAYFLGNTKYISIVQTDSIIKCTFPHSLGITDSLSLPICKCCLDLRTVFMISHILYIGIIVTDCLAIRSHQRDPDPFGNFSHICMTRIRDNIPCIRFDHHIGRVFQILDHFLGQNSIKDSGRKCHCLQYGDNC